MYEYDSILNGQTSRDAYTEKLHDADNQRRIQKLTSSRKYNGILNAVTYAINIFS